MDRVQKTVPGGRTSSGKSTAAVRVESVTWYVQSISLSGTEIISDYSPFPSSHSSQGVWMRLSRSPVGSGITQHTYTNAHVQHSVS